MISRARIPILSLMLLAWSNGGINAEALPRHGEFIGYLFCDRWGQDVFDYFYVHPNVAKQLDPNPDAWHPIKLNCSKISQPINPGGAMIHRIDGFTRLDPPGLNLRLMLPNDTVRLNDRLAIQVVVENESDRPVKFRRGTLTLRLTVAAPAVSLDGKRDETLYYHRNQYGLGNMEDKRIRATAHETLSFHQTIPSKSSREFIHVVKASLSANEYELQVYYRPGEGLFPVPYILSPPVSLDVVAGQNQQ